jgi:hypothetical protein
MIPLVTVTVFDMVTFCWQVPQVYVCGTSTEGVSGEKTDVVIYRARLGQEYFLWSLKVRGGDVRMDKRQVKKEKETYMFARGEES